MVTLSKTGPKSDIIFVKTQSVSGPQIGSKLSTIIVIFGHLPKVVNNDTEILSKNLNCIYLGTAFISAPGLDRAILNVFSDHFRDT